MQMNATVEINVRYQETDQMGIVYHGNYFTWFEVARIQLLEDLGCPYKEMEKQGYLLPVLHCSCDFMKPAKFSDTLVVEAGLSSISKVKITLEYEVKKENEIIAKGKSMHAFVDRNGKLQKAPVYFQKFIKTKLIDRN